MCVDGACTADAVVLAAVPLGGGSDDPAATGAAGLACEDGGTRRPRVVSIGVAPRVCTRTMAAGELCDDAGGAVRCADGGICDTSEVAGAPPVTALAGVCCPPVATPGGQWPCTANGSRGECVPHGTV